MVAAAAEEAAKRARRRSINCGVEGVFIPPTASIRLMTAMQVKNIKQEDVVKVVESFIDHVKTCKNVEVDMLQWTEVNLPKDEQLSAKLLLEAARVTKPALKMTRYALAFRMIRAIGMTYL